MNDVRFYLKNSSYKSFSQSFQSVLPRVFILKIPGTLILSYKVMKAHRHNKFHVLLAVRALQ